MTDKNHAAHGRTGFPKKKDTKPAAVHSQNQADGTAADRPAGETQAQSAQFNKGLADDSGAGEKKSNKPEHKNAGKIDPSSPTKGTEGGTTSMPRNPTMDSAGEIGEPSGKGTINLKENTMNKEHKNKEQSGKESQQTSQRSEQGEQNMSGPSNRQRGSSHSSQSGQKGGQQNDRSISSFEVNETAQYGDRKGTSKSSEFMDEDVNKGDRKTA